MATFKIAGDELHPYIIEADSYSFTVYKKMVSKEKKEYTSLMGHYSKLSSALREIVKLKSVDHFDGKEVNIHKYIAWLRKIDEQVFKMIR